MQKLKNSLEENYKQAVQEYHCTVGEQFNELKRQLNEARLKNEALDNSVALVIKKLEEINNGKVRDRKYVRNVESTKDISKEEGTKEMEQQWLDKVRTICERFDSFTREKNKELQLKQDLLDKKDTESSKNDMERKEEIQALTSKIHDLETKLDMKIRDVFLHALSSIAMFLHLNLLLNSTVFHVGG